MICSQSFVSLGDALLLSNSSICLIVLKIGMLDVKCSLQVGLLGIVPRYHLKYY